MQWERPARGGKPPRHCPECITIPVQRNRPQRVVRIDPTTVNYRNAFALVTYRLAIEEATCALRLGRVAEALARLEQVEAPTRHAPRHWAIPTPRTGT